MDDDIRAAKDIIFTLLLENRRLKKELKVAQDASSLWFDKYEKLTATSMLNEMATIPQTTEVSHTNPVCGTFGTAPEGDGNG